VPPERARPAAEEPAEEARSLGVAVQGFVDLVGWYTGLVGGHARKVADVLDGPTPAGGRKATDALFGELARAATFPLLGWGLAVGEMFEAAAVIVDPPQTERMRESDVFYVPHDWDPEQLVAVGPRPAGETTGAPRPPAGTRSPFVNGLGQPLTAHLTVVPAGRDDLPAAPRGDLPPDLPTSPAAPIPIKLVATGVPAECVGVYTGTVVRTDEADGEKIPVWIVVG
jgi:hypothetical protein